MHRDAKHLITDQRVWSKGGAWAHARGHSSTSATARCDIWTCVLLNVGPEIVTDAHGAFNAQNGRHFGLAYNGMTFERDKLL